MSEVVLIVESILIVLTIAAVVYLFRKTALSDVLLARRLKMSYLALVLCRSLVSNFEYNRKNGNKGGYGSRPDNETISRYVNWHTRKMRKADAGKYRTELFIDITR